MRVVVTEFMDQSALEEFGAGFSVEYNPDLVDRREELLSLLSDADAIIVRNRTQVDEALLAAAPNLQAVGRLGVGLDNIDVDACKRRDIAVLPATGANAISVAEYVVAAAMTLTRGAFISNAAMISGDWPRGALGRGGEVFGRKLGLFGFGMIAQEVAKRAKALGMSVCAHDPYLRDNAAAWSGVLNCSADEVLATSDIISLHVPLTNETQNMISATEFDAMKAGAILINTARGGIVNEPALAEALQGGKLAGAALDVFATEPLTADNAAIFKNCPNLILTPHIGGVTSEGNTRVSYLTAQNVKAVLQGGRLG